MSKRHARGHHNGANKSSNASHSTHSARFEAFTFGEPMPVLRGADILDYVECWSNGEWFEPPVSFAGLAKSFRASTHHSSALFFKVNVLASTFRPHKWLSRQAFERWALDYLIFGNGYLERRRNKLGETLRLEPALAKYVRRKSDYSGFVYVKSNRQDWCTRVGRHDQAASA